MPMTVSTLHRDGNGSGTGGYLASDHITPAPAAAEQLRLGKALIPRLDERRGPYTRLDSGGYQILLD
jgi:CHASE2 domain-containing sensor protein